MARPEPRSWNDGSRLATVHCLIDFHTLSIDGSQYSTFDKIYVAGHYYSDKSPLPALPMAAMYQAWIWVSCATAADWPKAFCLLMTWAFSPAVRGGRVGLSTPSESP